MGNKGQRSNWAAVRVARQPGVAVLCRRSASRYRGILGQKCSLLNSRTQISNKRARGERFIFNCPGVFQAVSRRAPRHLLFSLPLSITTNHSLPRYTWQGLLRLLHWGIFVLGRCQCSRSEPFSGFKPHISATFPSGHARIAHLRLADLATEIRGDNGKHTFGARCPAHPTQ